MSYISTQVKVKAASRQLIIKRRARKKVAKIDRSETSFGGKGCLTKEQYEKGLAMSRNMQDMVAW